MQANPTSSPQSIAAADSSPRASATDSVPSEPYSHRGRTFSSFIKTLLEELRIYFRLFIKILCAHVCVLHNLFSERRNRHFKKSLLYP